MRPRKFPSFIALAAFTVAATVGACAAHSGTVNLDGLPVNGTGAQVALLLDRVKVVDTRPETPGYERGCSPGEGCVFGPAWTDDHNGTGGHNGCGTRDDVLAAQLTEVVFRPGSRQCVVIAGLLQDPYTGVPIEFRKAEASKVQIDHIYPLALAWDMGASTWVKQRRVDFANDRANLLAVDGRANLTKGDRGPAGWDVPLNASYRCTYIKRFLTVALGYDLPITKADAETIRNTAARCA